MCFKTWSHRSHSRWSNLDRGLEESRFLRAIGSTKAWFKYASEERERRFTSLILVTGVIKCKSWNVAAISNSSRSHSGKLSLSLVSTVTGSLSASHYWRNNPSNMCRSGPHTPSLNENQCVFIRGYRVMKQNPGLRFLWMVKAADLRKKQNRLLQASETNRSSGFPAKLVRVAGHRSDHNITVTSLRNC